MSQEQTAKAEMYLDTLCRAIPSRRTGSPGNRQATDFLQEIIRSYGYEIDATPFACLDYMHGEPSLTHNTEAFEVYTSPYSLPCEVTAPLVVASTVDELEEADCKGKILLMKGALCSEQLMPKNFVFYNPEHHQRIIALLERRSPAALITATGRHPDQAGALDPFPLIFDGDFDIPSVYCRETVGEVLAERTGGLFQLKIDARRIPSSAANVIAKLNSSAPRKITVTAHIDAYEGTPGALDNASGTVVSLLLAGMLSDYEGEHRIEIALLNGEDHYSAAGEMDYLARYGDTFSDILLAINIDGVGYRQGGSAYSFYGCTPELQGKAEAVFGGFDGLTPGEQWFSGDHMLFVQSGVPSLALTSELIVTVIHTPLDTPDLLDCHKLVEAAHALNALIRAM